MESIEVMQIFTIVLCFDVKLIEQRLQLVATFAEVEFVRRESDQ